MRVAIVGCGGSNGAYLIEQTVVGEAALRFDEVWAINHQVLWIKHDLGIIIDDRSLFEAECPRLFSYMMSEDATPFVTCHTSEYPRSIPYPIDDVITALNDDLLNNVGAYAVALAIAKGYDMTLYGLDYHWEKDLSYEAGGQNVAYLIGLARGRGLKVHVTMPSQMLDTNTVRVIDGVPRRKLYGYVEQPPMGHLPMALGVEAVPL